MSDKKDDGLVAFGVALLGCTLVFGVLCGFFVGGCAYSEQVRVEAVKAGAATYVTENGRPVFKWTPPASTKE